MITHSVFVFDLDGVITNPKDSSVDIEAVRHIHQLIENGVFVAVNTGRSYVWVKQHLLGTLQSMGVSNALDHVFIVCEKGGESIMWTNRAFTPMPSRLALSNEVHATTPCYV